MMTNRQLPGFITRPHKHFYKLILLGFVIIPMIVSPWIVWSFFSWFNLLMFVILYIYIYAAFGSTIGLHRFYTHSSFKVKESHKWLEWFLGIQTGATIEGKIADWVRIHLDHHAGSDTINDPHTPWIYKLIRTMDNAMDEPTKTMDVVLGLIYAQFGWLFNGLIVDPNRHPARLRDNPIVKRLSRWYWYWGIVVMSFIIPLLLGGLTALLLHQSVIRGALGGVLWGGVLRMVMVHHVTWSINSLCHVFGKQPYKTTDSSRNLSLWYVLQILSFGESLHNFHHAFPRAAWNNLNVNHWWEDISGAVIRWAEKIGWIEVLSQPTESDRIAKLRQAF